MPMDRDCVLRGGSWLSHRAGARCSARYWAYPVDWYYVIGVRVSFRLVRGCR